jgi:hypothetical protein
MARFQYTDEQRADFLEHASQVGITRAMRDLKYPKSWHVANRWVNAAGIEVPKDAVKAQAQATKDWYQTEELLLVAQIGIERVSEELMNSDLSPDEHKKLSEAFQKYSNTWLLLMGKANNISETRSRDSVDLDIMELINAENAKNALIEKEASPTES